MIYNAAVAVVVQHRPLIYHLYKSKICILLRITSSLSCLLKFFYMPLILLYIFFLIAES